MTKKHEKTTAYQNKMKEWAKQSIMEQELPSAEEDFKRWRKEGLHADLIRAAYDGDIEWIHELIKKGADINTKAPREPMLALSVACRYGNLELVKFLIEKGADVNYSDWNGLTSLHVACGMDHIASYPVPYDINHPEIVKLLLNAGADITALYHGSDGSLSHSAKDFAQMSQRGEIENILQSYLDKKLLEAVTKYNGYPEEVERLLVAGGNVNLRNNNGETLLSIAVMDGRFWVVEILLENGADVHAELKIGKNALRLAKWNLGYRIVKTLEDHINKIKQND